ncbi:hypothetical protein SAMN05661010_03657 [Modicisalibacter muralis]|uniref:Uncharacterized protein n=1 Tax=Modicisalibacter muralis TaxID=119000 RepID=A0A1G9RCA8_9GAMM|nr:hypothetical protein [Halomonas muralis]SDM20886.1 hypothetical protein SAMN05661010_03657 [Halomonas muralis]
MGPIELFVGFAGVFFGLLGLALLFVASVVALFKIDEADHYYGKVGKLGFDMSLKGLPFSLNRMTRYGMMLLFSETLNIQKRYAKQLEEVEANTPPKYLKRLLVWLYASWLICGLIAAILGGILIAFFQ